MKNTEHAHNITQYTYMQDTSHMTRQHKTGALALKYDGGNQYIFNNPTLTPATTSWKLLGTGNTEHR